MINVLLIINNQHQQIGRNSFLGVMKIGTCIQGGCIELYSIIVVRY